MTIETIIQPTINALLTALGTGAGIAIGTYASNKLLIEHIEKRLNKKKKKAK